MDLFPPASRNTFLKQGLYRLKFESLPKGVRLAVEAAKEKKAAGITVLDLSGASAFTEFFIICTGFSTPQIQAICTEIEDQLYKNLAARPNTAKAIAPPNGLCSISAASSSTFSASKARRYYDLELSLAFGAQNWKFRRFRKPIVRSNHFQFTSEPRTRR